MMRLRCPNRGCSIDVADDMIGARIRCPQCEQLLFVDPKYQESTLAPDQPGTPAASVDSGPAPEPAQPTNLENRLYEGMPPLSVMLALRAGRGPAWKDDGELRAMMTADDWTALAAFENVLRANAALKTSLWLGIGASAFTLLVWLAAAEGSAWETRSLLGIIASQPITLVLLCTGFLAAMEMGRRRLMRLQTGVFMELAAWAAMGFALFFTLETALVVMRGSDHVYFPALLFPTPIQLMAALSAGVASLRLQQALTSVGPPEILQRLAEALKFLD